MLFHACRQYKSTLRQIDFFMGLWVWLGFNVSPIHTIPCHCNTFNYFQLLIESAGSGFQWCWKSPEIHGIVHVVFNDRWKCSRQVHVFFMAFLRSMKTSVNYKLKVISSGKKRKHDPWKFHLCWIKQWPPQKQNYNFKQNDFKFQFRLSWVFFSQTILSSTSVPSRKFAGSCFSFATTIVHKTRS